MSKTVGLAFFILGLFQVLFLQVAFSKSTKDYFTPGIYTLAKGSDDCSVGRVDWINDQGVKSLQIGPTVTIVRIDAEATKESLDGCLYLSKSESKENKLIQHSDKVCNNGTKLFRKIEVTGMGDSIAYSIYNKTSELENFKLVLSCTLNLEK